MGFDTTLPALGLGLEVLTGVLRLPPFPAGRYSTCRVILIWSNIRDGPIYLIMTVFSISKWFVDYNTLLKCSFRIPQLVGSMIQKKESMEKGGETNEFGVWLIGRRSQRLRKSKLASCLSTYFFQRQKAIFIECFATNDGSATRTWSSGVGRNGKRI